MGRTVIVGTPALLAKLLPTDLPSDFDLRHSFWRWVDFRGFDLSAYDMRNIDIFDSKGDGCKLGVGKTALMMSRRTTWTGASLPSDVSSYNHDLVVEVYNQASNIALPAVSGARNYVAASYDHSWQDTIQQLVNQGLTVPQMRIRFTTTFAGYPRLLSRMNQHLDNKSWGPAPIWTNTRTRADGADFDAAPLISGNDRWALARQLEVYIKNHYGRDVRCFFLQLDPSPVLRVIGMEQPELFGNPNFWQRFSD